MGIDLLYLARDHDLPPAWDGHRVEWDGWTETPWTTAELHARDREVCHMCGAAGRPVRNTGTYRSRSRRTGRVQTGRLVVYRCPECRHDRVWETWHDTWWDLDPSDYGDEGSRVLRPAP